MTVEVSDVDTSTFLELVKDLIYIPFQYHLLEFMALLVELNQYI